MPKNRTVEFNYNTRKGELVIPEYGRNIQDLIRHARTIEDNVERQAYVETIVNLMQQMHPQSRNLEDSIIKLWQHVFRIAEYDLNVIPPIGKVPTPEDAEKRPDILEYPLHEPKFKHYGYNVQVLIQKAIEMEDAEKKKAFVRIIASYMKLAYKSWNKDMQYVSDDSIRGDLKALSKGLLELDDERSIQTHSTGSRPQNRRNSHSNNRRRPSNNRSSNGRSPRSSNKSSKSNNYRRR